jgi:hypothetical protein
LRCGVLVVVVRVLALVTAVKTIAALRVDIITLRQLMFKEVGSILFVLLVSIVVAIESVLDAVVVHLM